MNEEMTEEQAAKLLRDFAAAKQNVHTFFSNIIKSADTTKVGNLSEDELGVPKLPVRTYKELALFADDVYGDKSWSDYFTKLSEIQTSTSLSKEALLLRLSVTQKKELADVSPQSKKKNKGWFRKKDSGGTV